MTSFLYVIVGEDESRCKIGISDKPHRRLKDLQTGNPEVLRIHYTEEVSSHRQAELLESKIHQELALLRLKGEWFLIDPETATQEVQYHYIRWNDDPLLR